MFLPVLAGLLLAPACPAFAVVVVLSFVEALVALIVIIDVLVPVVLLSPIIVLEAAGSS